MCCPRLFAKTLSNLHSVPKERELRVFPSARLPGGMTREKIPMSWPTPLSFSFLALDLDYPFVFSTGNSHLIAHRRSCSSILTRKLKDLHTHICIYGVSLVASILIYINSWAHTMYSFYIDTKKEFWRKLCSPHPLPNKEICIYFHLYAHIFTTFSEQIWVHRGEKNRVHRFFFHILFDPSTH